MWLSKKVNALFGMMTQYLVDKTESDRGSMLFNWDMFPTQPGILPVQNVTPAHDTGTPSPLG